MKHVQLTRITSTLIPQNMAVRLFGLLAIALVSLGQSSGAQATAMSCAAGYTLNGEMCEKVDTVLAAPTEVFSCPEGRTLSEDKQYCATTTDQIPETTYSCPGGGSLTNGDQSCESFTDRISTTVYSCPPGRDLTDDNQFCGSVVDQVPNTTYSCPAGYSVFGERCLNLIDSTPNTTYTCPAGYEIFGGTCLNLIDSTSTTTYTCPAGYDIFGGTCLNLINSTATTTYSCPAGRSLTSDLKCESLVAKVGNTTYSCPTGYGLSSDNVYCSTTTAQRSSTTYSCPGGYSRSGTTCSKVVTTGATATTSYSCPSGYQLNVDPTLCQKLVPQASTNPRCPSGYSTFGPNWCLRLVGSTPNTTYSCPVGYSRSGTTCSKTLSEQASSTTTYYCPSGYVKWGTVCLRTINSTATTTYSCPAGYADNGTNCRNVVGSTANTTYSCPAGRSLTSDNLYCSTTTAQIPNVTYSCPAGRTLTPDKLYCSATTDQIPNVTYSCPAGRTLTPDNLFCSSVVDQIANTTYDCPAGYEVFGSKCLNLIVSTQNIEYSCPAGYVINGETCQKVVNSLATTEMVCPADYEIWENTCLNLIFSTSETVYECPADYSPSGTECTKVTHSVFAPPTTQPTNFQFENMAIVGGQYQFRLTWQRPSDGPVDITYMLLSVNGAEFEALTRSDYRANSEVLSVGSSGNHDYEVAACTGQGPSLHCGPPEALTVVAPETAVTASWSPPEIDSGEDATFTWEADYALSCTGPDNQPSSQPTVSTPATPTETTEYVVTCTGPGGQSVTAAATVVVNEVVDPVIPPEEVALGVNPAPAPAAPPAAGDSTLSDRIGAIAGSFAVGPAGEATYSMSFAAAPGSGGVAPDIGLTYSSSGGNGIAGMGTSLSGLSAISRCRQTLVQDDNAEPITFTDDDRFCLDGQRLILVSGSYGHSGSEYRTEIDSYRRVTALGGVPGEPEYFLVESKDGSTATYGVAGPTDGRQRLFDYQGAEGPVFVWKLVQFRDSVGNRIVHEYNTSRNRIERIVYAFGADPAGGAVIDFEYQLTPRPDPLLSYVSGYKLETPDRLSRVVSYNSGQILREYRFNYLPDSEDGYSRLDFVEECAGGNCLQPTTFTWSAQAVDSIGFASAEVSADAITSKYVSGQPADLNGDGHMDLLWVSVQSSLEVELNASIYDAVTNKYTYAGISTGRFELKSDAQRSWRVVDFNGDGSQDIAFVDKYGQLKILLTIPGHTASSFDWGNLVHTGIDLDPTNSGTDKMAIAWGDMDADGLPDLLYHLENDALRIRFMERNPNAGNCGPNWPDGLPCAYRLGGDDYSIQYVAGALSPAVPGGDSVIFPSALLRDNFKVNDFDGDGRVDLFAVQNLPCDLPPGEVPPAIEDACASSIIDNFLAFRTTSRDDVNKRVKVSLFDWSDAVWDIDMPARSIQASDLNGDGLGDVLFESTTAHGTWYYQLSDGVSLGEPLLLGTMTDGEERFMKFADVNRDGYRDIVMTENPGGGPSASAMTAYLWDNELRQFESQRWTVKSGITAQDDRRHMLFDVNGDGFTDWVDLQFGDLSSQRNVRVSLALGDFDVTDRIVEINNGLGVATRITYAGVNDPSAELADFYTRDNDAHNPRWQLASFEPGFNDASDLDAADRPPTFDISPAMYLVRTVCSTAPAGGNAENCATGSGVSRQTYSYTGAKLQGKGRGFLGFRQVRIEDLHSSTYTLNEYRQDFPFTGRPRVSVTQHNNGSLLKQVYTNHGKSSVKSFSATAANFDKVFNTYTAAVIEDSFDPDSGARLGRTATNYNNGVLADPTWDGWGNLLYSRVQHYEGGSSVPYASVTTTSSYGSGDEQRLGRLRSATVVHERDGETPISRTSEFTYYQGGIHNGLLSTEAVVVSDGSEVAEKRHFYDTFGNKSKIEMVGAVDEVGTLQTRSKSWQYSEGRYLLREQTLMGSTLVTTREVFARDPVLGLPTLEQDINGVQTSTVYGAFGRPFFSYSSTGAWSRSRFEETHGACPVGTQYVNRTESAGGGQTVTCYDALGRKVGAGKQAFNGGYDRAHTTYNELGLVVSQTNPFNTSFNGSTVSSYDIYGRLQQVTEADNAVTGYSYSGLTTTIVNANGQSSTETRNSKGELARATDNGGSIDYRYHAAGKLTHTTVNAGDSVTTAILYDDLGRKTQMVDPDKGTWTYRYNAFGELIEQTNANGEQTFLAYDNVGRKVSRSDRSGAATVSTTTWSYDSFGGRTQWGSLLRVNHSDAYAMSAGRVEDVHYDGFGRVAARSVGISGLDVHTQFYTYDQFGRPFQVYGAAGQYTGVEYGYNAHGYQSLIKDSAITGSGQRIWSEVISQDSRGNVTVRSLKSGDNPTQVTHTFNALNGRLTGIQAQNSGGVWQDMNYGYDALGNVTSMVDGTDGHSDGYTYDSLNRLVQETVAGAGTTMSYAPNGNIASRDGAAYSYDSARPHAVTMVDGATLSYDANGNVTQSDGRALHYTVFDKPHTITRGASTAYFAYGADRGRFKQELTVNGSRVTTYYVLGLEIIVKDAQSTVEYRRSIGGVAQETTVRGLGDVSAVTSVQRRFFLRDHLGSVDTFLGYDGLPGEFSSTFGPFGQRRDQQTLQTLVDEPVGALDYLREVTHRGYTGHEMLDTFGLIHMNGRVYDPQLARFMSADPYIQFPNNTQSYNRYTYVLNNPLGYTDPSGYFVSLIASAAMVAMKVEASTMIAGTVLASMADTALNGGDLGDVIRAGVISGVSAFAFSAVGASDTFGYAPGDGFSQLAVNSIANGVVGGSMSLLSGGKFNSGFMSAGLSALGKQGIHKSIGTSAKALPLRVVARAALGGTVSEVSGGKFANGAATSAFAQIFNDEVSLARTRSYWATVAKAAKVEAERINGLSSEAFLEEFSKHYGFELDPADPSYHMKLGFAKDRIVGELMGIKATEALRNLENPSASLPGGIDIAGDLATDLGKPTTGRLLGSVGTLFSLKALADRMPYEDFYHSVDYSCKGHRCTVGEIWVQEK